jgi:hypothetical protein
MIGWTGSDVIMLLVLTAACGYNALLLNERQRNKFVCSFVNSEWHTPTADAFYVCVMK